MGTTDSVVCVSGYGQGRWLAKLPGASDALDLVLLQPVGQQDDAVLRDHATLGALLAAGNRECTAPGYRRLRITIGITEAVDAVNNRVDVDIPDQLYASPGLGAMTGANAKQDQAALLVCYVPNTAAAADGTTLVLSKHYYPFVADGRDASIPFPNGFYRAQGV